MVKNIANLANNILVNQFRFIEPHQLTSECCYGLAKNILLFMQYINIVRFLSTKYF